MTGCPNHRRLQAYLDGDLAPRERDALGQHLRACAECSAESAAYRALFGRLRLQVVADPGPSLTERILDRVLPSRLRQRWINAIGWSYGLSSAVSTFLFISWIVRPETHIWLTQVGGATYLRLMQLALFLMHSTTLAWVRLWEGWGWLATIAGLFAPLIRGLQAPLRDPWLQGALWAALLTIGLLLWWMRSRGEREEVEHVDLLGF